MNARCVRMVNSVSSHPCLGTRTRAWGARRFGSPGSGSSKESALCAMTGRVTRQPTRNDARRALQAACRSAAGDRGITQLEGLCAANQPYAIRQQAIAGLTMLDLAKAAHHAGMLLVKIPPVGQDPGDVVAAFLARKDGAQALAKVLAQQQPAADAARIGLRVLVERGIAAPELQAVLQQAVGQPGAKRKLDAQEMKRWIALVQSAGDPARGEAVFRRVRLGCYQCHVHALARRGPRRSRSAPASVPVPSLITSSNRSSCRARSCAKATRRLISKPRTDDSSPASCSANPPRSWSSGIRFAKRSSSPPRT